MTKRITIYANVFTDELSTENHIEAQCKLG